MITRSLFYYYENVFILMNIWMIGKNLKKHHHLKKKIFIFTYIWKILLMQIARMQKEFVKILKLGEYHDLHIQNDTLL